MNGRDIKISNASQNLQMRRNFECSTTRGSFTMRVNAPELAEYSNVEEIQMFHKWWNIEVGDKREYTYYSVSRAAKMLASQSLC